MNNLNQTRVSECLADVNFPATKDEMAKHAKKTCGDSEVVSFLSNLRDKEYNSTMEVAGQIGMSG
jgi:hypothetical protein